MKPLRFARALLGLLLLAGSPGTVLARQSPSGAPPAEALRVFLDCNARCDFDYFRKEMLYINWARDRTDADVHLLITSEGTGSGGQAYTMKYIGLKAFQGQDDEFTFATRQGDTEDEIRRLVSQRIALGLARYLGKGSVAGRFTLTFAPPEGGPPGSAAPKPRDPWNLWVMSAGVNANFNGESQNSSNSYSGRLSARRVAERWKFSASVRGSRNNSRYELEDTTLRTHRSNYNFFSQVVRSLGDHWSFGTELSASRSTTSNTNLSARFSPGIEYDVYPYKESTRRQFVLVYQMGLSYANYRDTTIYNKITETRPFHSLTAAVEATQPWGSVNGSLTLSAYLNDWSKNHLSLNAGCQVRIVRGLNFNVGGGYDRVRDQLYLSKAGVSDEEILLQLKQLKTSYFYYMFTGLNYTFGSKFNNIVNPRFTSTGGGGGNCFCSNGNCFCN